MPLPPSPLKLSHRRLSDADDFLLSPGAEDPNRLMSRSPTSPRTPQFSVPSSPVTLRHGGAGAMNGSLRDSVDFSTESGGGGGLGNLADELADAWEQEEDGYDYASGQEMGTADSQNMEQSDVEDGYLQPTSQMHTRSSSTGSPDRKDRLRTTQLRQHRRQESHYDGSDYGNDSDLEEVADISPSLEMQLSDIESLARRGIENNGSESDHIIQRTVEALRDLGGQSGIENGAMRLITAHSSITSHLTHQTRTLQSLIHPLLFSPFPLLSEDAIDSLMPLIDEGLLPNLPYPFPEQPRRDSRPTTPSQQNTQNPLMSLQALVSQTADLTASLRSLGDTLYESRQLTATASRRLRSARELVVDIRREEESREEGSRWIELGEWDRRLQSREAGQECRDVVNGFETVCGEWREKLFGPSPEVVAT
ncbi:Uncharacterized protein PECH_004084 [Penicillium ucsense]|uniref:Uncharacterized protein n=1 Tax=Penicillium ucsense TaxID=2839758 RepID=A0A8J8VWE0_9EURO|nr:Uncharacterized protein PECM_002555 [Penicillium ucsense]KAF7728790.1 Uncharacterized protein PECH_004084 [Penicillium ucsense]